MTKIFVISTRDTSLGMFRANLVYDLDLKHPKVKKAIGHFFEGAEHDGKLVTAEEAAMRKISDKELEALALKAIAVEPPAEDPKSSATDLRERIEALGHDLMASEARATDADVKRSAAEQKSAGAESRIADLTTQLQTAAVENTEHSKTIGALQDELEQLKTEAAKVPDLEKAVADLQSEKAELAQKLEDAEKKAAAKKPATKQKADASDE